MSKSADRFTPDTTAEIHPKLHARLARLAEDYADRHRLSTEERADLLGMIGWPA